MAEPRAASDAAVILESVSNPARFSFLVDAHGDAVFRYLARRVGATVAEDLAAETFFCAFRARARYRDDNDSALPWLYGIATNVLRSHRRGEQRRIDMLARLAGQAVLDAGADRVDDAMCAAASLQRVARGFAALSQSSRDVLVLIAIEGLTYEQVAIALDVPAGTIRSRLSRIRAELRKSLPETSNL